jgi:hypothetical protein
MPATGLLERDDNKAVRDGSIADAAILRVCDMLIRSGDLEAPAMPPEIYFDRSFVRAVAK